MGYTLVASQFFISCIGLRGVANRTQTIPTDSSGMGSWKICL